MRDYATVAPQFWLGKTGRELRKKGAEAQVVSFYLMTSPHANMLGLYYLPILYIAHETGLGLEGALKGLKSAIEAGFCSYDEDTEMVWVHEMAAYQVGKALKPGDNRCAGVRSEYASLTENPFLSSFYERYKNDFHLNIKRETRQILEGASKGLLSQDQEQDQEQEKDKDPLGHGSATPPDGESFDDAPSEKPKSHYSEEFEQAWREYPKRAGGNSKVDAFKAWTARIKSGATAQELTDGVRRYADYVTAAGKLNTEYVKQASTFFGPSKHYEELWRFEVPTGKRDPNSISQPDKLIPSGFRG
ncbi:MAG: DNA-binding protein [Klebsiella pneumoniae]|uniref:DNA-binding protein n=1 Tax=Klebsiella pneumoniae TaxID=573 RepID=UPI00066805F3|nr:DNA-binding protein [Klebsiella pneumoniae]MBD0038881.1 DNA-binding protein [Klebsiella pneumoniae]MDH1770725.1 DNA-binding protein [Klebsiella pneumoniae]MDU1898063.1 DNA-binding protein [Klebsiella pneumoniae]HBU2515740.1 DNA-binding protein [Klebsiella pneumoniae]HBU2593154.1 DNA-binding protein [Klebsiella pneumoniae]